KLSSQYKFEVKEINKQLVNDIAVSSTRIRLALEEGDIDTANELLGYHYMMSGKVEQGDKRGRTIGFPTANIKSTDSQKLIPGRGVYIATAKVGEHEHRAMVNIGIRPTVDGTSEHIEAHLLFYDGDLYDKTITLHFHKRLRDEQKFSGLEELKTQLQKDKEETERYFF